MRYNSITELPKHLTDPLQCTINCTRIEEQALPNSEDEKYINIVTQLREAYSERFQGSLERLLQSKPSPEQSRSIQTYLQETINVTKSPLSLTKINQYCDALLLASTPVPPKLDRKEVSASFSRTHTSIAFSAVETLNLKGLENICLHSFFFEKAGQQWINSIAKATRSFSARVVQDFVHHQEIVDDLILWVKKMISKRKLVGPAWKSRSGWEIQIQVVVARILVEVHKVPRQALLQQRDCVVFKLFVSKTDPLKLLQLSLNLVMTRSNDSESFGCKIKLLKTQEEISVHRKAALTHYTKIVDFLFTSGTCKTFFCDEDIDEITDAGEISEEELPEVMKMLNDSMVKRIMFSPGRKWRSKLELKKDLIVAEKLGMKNVPKVSDYAQYELENQSIQEPRPYLSFADQQREENRKKAESLASSSFLHPPPSNSLSTLDINHKVPVLPQDSDTTVTIDTSLPISQTVVEVLPVVRAIVEGKSFLSDIEVPLGFTENLNTSADFDDTNYDDLPGLEDATDSEDESSDAGES